MRTEEELRRAAYRIAAALLADDMDRAEIVREDEYTEQEEEFVREYIRTVVVGVLRGLGTRKAAPGGRGRGPDSSH